MQLSPESRYRGWARLRYFPEAWRRIVFAFCKLYALLVGLAFLLNPVLPTVTPTSIFYRWGEAGLVVFGVAFLALFCWSVAFPEHGGRIVTATVLGCIGLYSSHHVYDTVRPAAILGYIIWGPVLATTLHAGARGLAALRRGGG